MTKVGCLSPHKINRES